MLGRRPELQLDLFVYLPDVPMTGLRAKLDRLEQTVDFTWVREHAAGCFASCGRPSIDPVVMVKMLLVRKLFNVASDRQLVDFCSDSLACRRFLGFGLDEQLPCHSSFTEWRERLGAEWFEGLFKELLRQVLSHGMTLSTSRTVDATSVKAQASFQGPVVRVPREVDDVPAWLDAYDAGDVVEPGAEDDHFRVNRHDPDARYQRKDGENPDFRYQVSFCADAETGLVVDTKVKGLEHAGTMVEHLADDPGPVREMVADKLYDSATALAGVQALGVKPFVAVRPHFRGNGITREAFVYHANGDYHTCPRGRKLRFTQYVERIKERRYVASRKDCTNCPIHGWCTKATFRTVTRHEHEAAREQTVRGGARYRQLMRRRRINEHINRVAKRDHGMARADGRGLDDMRIQAALTAAAINLNKLWRWQDRHLRAPSPISAMANASRAEVRDHVHLVGWLARALQVA